MMEVWRTLQTILEPLIAEKISARAHRTRTQGSITLYSLDSADTADAFRRRAIALAVVNECAMVRELMTVWSAPVGRARPICRGPPSFSAHERFRSFKVLWERGAIHPFQIGLLATPNRKQSIIAASEIAAAKQELSEHIQSRIGQLGKLGRQCFEGRGRL